MKRIAMPIILALFSLAAIAADPSLRVGIIGGWDASFMESDSDYYRNYCLGAQLDVSTLISVRPYAILNSRTTKSQNI